MDTTPLKTEADYDRALQEAAMHFGSNEPPPGTPEAARFQMLVTLTEAYENEHWRI